jgi:uncharacterized membrane protein YbaN (DUF454 family)
MSAITTVSILIVYIALWPVIGVVDEIRVSLIIYAQSFPNFQTFLIGRRIFSPYAHTSQRSASR